MSQKMNPKGRVLRRPTAHLRSSRFLEIPNDLNHSHENYREGTFLSHDVRSETCFQLTKDPKTMVSSLQYTWGLLFPMSLA